MAWFPRPTGAEDIEVLAPAALPRHDVLRLLTSPDAEEWAHKVGVAGPVDGSAKPTTRLLATSGWVLKTRLDLRSSSQADLRGALIQERAPGLSAALWHPDKTWALLRADGSWYPLTICPQLQTLRALETLPERLAAWIRMAEFAVDLGRAHGLGLDLNPANFGRARASDRLYYIDDEFYPEPSLRNLASSLVARIPEEPLATDDHWREWGERLREVLAPRVEGWAQLCDEARGYPIAARFERARDELVRGLCPPLEGRRRAPQLTCVLADVHANLPALEAVLEDARAQGADSFLFLGDAVGYGPDPSACIARLADLPRTVWVRGNHDHAIATGNLDLGMNRLARECAEWTRDALSAEERAWLGSLPPDHREETWLAVHGAPRDPHRFLAYVYELTYEDNLRFLRDAALLTCFYGHTHVQLAHVETPAGPVKLSGPREFGIMPKQRYLVNPGSVGQPRDGDARAAYALWDRPTGRVTSRRVGYDVSRTIARLRTEGLSNQLEERLLKAA